MLIFCFFLDIPVSSTPPFFFVNKKNRTKTELLEVGYSPNTDTYIPILVHLLLHRKRAEFVRELESMPQTIVPAVYVPVARANAVSTLLRRGAVDALKSLLMDIEPMGGSVAVTRAFNDGLVDACAQGFGAQCAKFLPLISTGVVTPNSVTYAAISNCLAMVLFPTRLYSLSLPSLSLYPSSPPPPPPILPLSLSLAIFL